MLHHACMSELSDQIAADALKAQSTSVDGVSVSRRSLADQIAADKYLADKAATSDMSSAIRGMIFKIVPPGGH